MSRRRQPAKRLLSRQVARLRRAANLTQERLALQAGLSRTYITEIETEKRNVTLRTLDRIALALDVPVAVLLEDC